MNWPYPLELAQRGVIPLLVVLGALIAALLTPPLSRKFQLRPLPLFVSLVSSAVIVAVTWPIEGRHALSNVRDTWDGSQILEWWRYGWGKTPFALWGTFDGRMNIALFVPAGLFWTLTLRRPVRVMLGLFVLSFAAESLQAMTGFRAADATDLITNSTGSVLGVLSGMILIAFNRRFFAKGAADSKAVLSGLRPGLIAAGITLIALTGAYGYAQSASTDERDALLHDLRAAFEGTTSADIVPLLTDPAGPAPLDRFAGRAGVPPDDIARFDDSGDVEARYPAGFEGSARCVFVRWEADGTSFRTADGAACVGVS